MSWILDQQLVVHVFTQARGPGAGAGFRALEEIWQACAIQFRMTEPIPGVNLPHLLAGISDRLPADGEIPLAAQERPGADCQAVLRLHHDLLNLSIALAPPEASAPVPSAAGEEHWPWWQVFDRQWSAIIGQHAKHLLGEVRLYLARVNDEAGVLVPSSALYESLRRLLPVDATGPQRPSTGVSGPGGLALWETSTGPDGREVRRFAAAIAPGADAAASAWVWSQGDPVIPPLARYLLHAAKLRFEMRVWQRDSQARQLRASLDALSAELARLGAAEPAKAELLQLTRFNASLLHADLRDLRHTVEIAADNMGRAFDVTGLMAAGGPFADDAALARYLLERLDDEVAYLGRATERAEQAARIGPGAARAAAARAAERDPAGLHAPDEAEDLRRNVFVVYGRDEPARRALFEFLRALGLRPLEWEAVVAQTGKGAPSLSEAVRRGLAAARAVVVLMTPEDVVRLHPDLHGPREPAAETGESLQARPNVLLELGMALVTHPDRTLVLMVGDHRPVTDLGGLNFIRIDGTADCRKKVAGRLKLAGCRVADGGQDWLHAGDFAGLAALRRSPQPPAVPGADPAGRLRADVGVWRPEPRLARTCRTLLGRGQVDGLGGSIRVRDAATAQRPVDAACHLRRAEVGDPPQRRDDVPVTRGLDAEAMWIASSASGRTPVNVWLADRKARSGSASCWSGISRTGSGPSDRTIDPAAGSLTSCCPWHARCTQSCDAISPSTRRRTASLPARTVPTPGPPAVASLCRVLRLGASAGSRVRVRP